jgi:alanine dehydrogenase
MIIGIPAEVKRHEYRVSLVPAGVEELKQAGHQVLVEATAGIGSGIEDEDYRQAGAEILGSAAEVFARAEMIVKVKEPQSDELSMIRPGQIIFTFFHFAASEELTRRFTESGAIAVAYETLRTPDGKLPLLTPMSEIAGRMSVHEGARNLERPFHGRGILLAGVPGVEPASVVVLGGGVVGANAAKIAAGLGANVSVLDVNLERLRYLDDIMPANVTTLLSNPARVRKEVRKADLLIGAVLVPGDRAPRLVSEELVQEMKKGAVIVDVAVDQGGCIATTRPTTHDDPTYVMHDVVHYCVTNMPGAVARTSTLALTNATFPFVAQIAELGADGIFDHPVIKTGIDIARGEIRQKALLRAFPMLA